MRTLKELEKTRSYLFHGTPNGNIDVFEPRQAMSHGKKDGEPCIAASIYIEPAIFMAIFSGRVSCGWNSNDSGFGFYLKKSDYDHAKSENWFGYVYVFEKELFIPHMAWEWRAFQHIKPFKKIKVTFSDLPKGIKLN
jgi:hypothetical protein